MKKIILSLLALSVFAVKAEAKNFEVWRTTISNIPVTDFSITTAPAYVYKIDITSTSTGSQFNIYGGTWVGGRSSTRTYETDVTREPYYPLMPYPTGFMLTTIGSSTVELYWDYLFKSPIGQESKGLDNR